MGEAASREARAEAPTTTPDRGVTTYSTSVYKNPLFRVETPLPPICETDSTKCGNYLVRSAPCPIRQDRGCLLLKDPRYHLVEVQV